jgi:hypothetical protein
VSVTRTGILEPQFESGASGAALTLAQFLEEQDSDEE